MANINGTSGDDHLKGSTRDDLILSFEGNDEIKAGSGDDTVDSGSGNNTIDGGAGADHITSGIGNDIIWGGSQNDTIFAGEGNNWVDGGSHNDWIVTGDGDDTVDGGSHDDTISSGGGKDLLDGGSGNDNIDSGGGSDTVLGGSGNDVIDAGGGKDFVDGGSGNDDIRGGGGDDVIDGGSGGDMITGNGGDDTITGGSGNDTMDGGAGADMFKFDAGSDNDTVNNFDQAEDVLCFDGLSQDDMTINYVDGNTIIAFDGGPTVTVNGVELSTSPTFDSKFFQGFETDTAGWLDNDDSPGFGDIARVASGTNGITSAAGDFHAIVSEGPSDSGAFTRFDAYRDTFPGTYKASADVFLDNSWAAGSGFELSFSSNGADGNHQRDFVFHVTKDTSTGDMLIAGDNNAAFAPREDLETLANHLVANDTGWYNFEAVFRDNGGVLAVDLNVFDSSHNLLFTQTLSNAGDTIPAEVGGNRYGWFTSVDVLGGIAVDNTSLMIQDGAPGGDWLCFS